MVTVRDLDSNAVERRRIKETDSRTLMKDSDNDRSLRKGVPVRSVGGKRQFILTPVHRPGDLKLWAKKNNALNEDGTINLSKAKVKAQSIKSPSEKTKILRGINLVENMNRARRNPVHKK